jgi:hypothetical protein
MINVARFAKRTAEADAKRLCLHVRSRSQFMKPRQNLRLIHYPVYLMMLVLCSAMGLANADEVIREVGTGSINWSQGVVYAVGYGTARSDTSPAQKRILSERAAVVDAQRNLLEMTQGVS